MKTGVTMTIGFMEEIAIFNMLGKLKVFVKSVNISGVPKVVSSI